MLAEMSAPQFRRWQAFYALEPLGEQRADWRAASICAAIWNTALMRVRSRKRFRPLDFLLEFTDAPKEQKEARRQSWQEMKSIAMKWAAFGNADEKRKKR